MSDKVVYWGHEDSEFFTAESLDSAIEAYLDNFAANQWPDVLVMVGVRPQQVVVNANEILETVLEELDEEHADPGGDPTEPTQTMIDAANTLAYVIESEYTSWACDAVETREINSLEWISGHRPDWLGEPEA